MPSQWYCRLMGTEMGPYTSKQLLEMARCHQITPDDSVKKGADGNWVSAHRVKGLFEDAGASTIIMASLPPEVKQALESKQKEAAQTAPPKSPAVAWHYLSEGNKVGPLSFEELVAHSREGLLKPNHRVWSSTAPKWRKAEDVEGLAFG